MAVRVWPYDDRRRHHIAGVSARRTARVWWHARAVSVSWPRRSRVVHRLLRGAGDPFRDAPLGAAASLGFLWLGAPAMAWGGERKRLTLSPAQTAPGGAPPTPSRRYPFTPCNLQARCAIRPAQGGPQTRGPTRAAARVGGAWEGCACGSVLTCPRMPRSGPRGAPRGRGGLRSGYSEAVNAYSRRLRLAVHGTGTCRIVQS